MSAALLPCASCWGVNCPLRREDAEEKAKRDEERREAFKRMPTRKAIRASIDELKGGEPDYAAKEAHRTESVRDTLRGSLEEIESNKQHENALSGSRLHRPRQKPLFGQG